MDALKTVFVPIHREGFVFVGIFALVTLIFFALWEPLGWIGAVLTCWCVYFFRDPDRYVPTREGLVVATGDGVVTKIEAVTPPAELGFEEDKLTRISIFLNVFNVHVNRVPIGGKITAIHYFPGKFLNASLDKASEDNERNSIVIQTDEGQRFAFVQIAGLVARRIICDVHEGQEVRTGERYGMIRFGSRCDIYLPKGVNPLVTVGQKTLGGETVIADLKSKEKAREGEVR